MFFLELFIFALAAMLSLAFFLKKLRAKRESLSHFQHSLYVKPESQESSLIDLMPAGLVTIEYLWQIYTIEPAVIRAINFSSTDNLNSAVKVSNYLLDNMVQKDEQAFLGFRNRLVGYIGEQKVSSLLEEKGAELVQATTSNQAVWDFMIDDELINVKTVLDIQSIKNIALIHPNVTYLIPEDTYIDTGIDNIQPLPGFSYTEVTDQFNQTIAQADGTVALNNFGTHLPMGFGLLALRERSRLIRAGGDKQAINKNVFIDASVRATGNFLMAKAGTLLGLGIGSLVFTPVAAGMLGAGIGAYTGSKLGRTFGKKLKELDLVRENQKLEALLNIFGSRYVPYLAKIRACINLPIHRKELAFEKFRESDNYTNSRGRIPFKRTLTLEKRFIFSKEMETAAISDIDKARANCSNINKVLNEIENAANNKLLGLLILNNIHLRELLPVDLIEVNKIYTQRRKVYFERYKLYPDRFPLSTEIKNKIKLYDSLAFK